MIRETVKLPKELCNILDEVKKQCPNGYLLLRTINRWWTGDYDVLNEIDEDLLMEALVLGYEPELTPENTAERFFRFCPVRSCDTARDSYRRGMIKALEIHNIHYDWMGNKNE